MKWIKGFIRGVYAIPIFIFRVFMSCVMILFAAIVLLGEWAHEGEGCYGLWKQGFQELWGIKNDQ